MEPWHGWAVEVTTKEQKMVCSVCGREDAGCVKTEDGVVCLTLIEEPWRYFPSTEGQKP